MTSKDPSGMQLDTYNASWDKDANNPVVSMETGASTNKASTEDTSSHLRRDSMCRSYQRQAVGNRAKKPDNSSEQTSSDHNFELLRSCDQQDVHTSETTQCLFSEGSKQRAARFQQDLARPLTGNNYLKEYQEKYGKLGIFSENNTPNEELPTKTRCFSFMRDQSTGKSAGKDLVSSLALASPAANSARDSVPSVASSWDPTIFSTPETLMSKYLDLDGESTLGKSAGKGWKCSVYDKDKENMLDEAMPGQGRSTECESRDSTDTPKELPKDYVAHCHMPSQSQSLSIAKVADMGRVDGAFTNPRYVDDNINGGTYRQAWASHVRVRSGSMHPIHHMSDSVDGPHLTGKDDFTSEVEEVVLEKNGRKTVRLRGSRRTVSDLGFTRSEPGIVATPRTAALLSNPAFRKHLARNLGVNEDDLDEKDFQYDYKLQLSHIYGSSSQQTPECSDSDRLSLGMSDGTDLRKKLLKTSVAETLRNGSAYLVKTSGASSLGGAFTGGVLTQTNPSELPYSSHEHNPSEGKRDSGSPNPFSVHRPDFHLNILKGKFHIPTFDEFRQAQRTRRLPTRSPLVPTSLSYDFMSSNTIYEEPESEDFAGCELLKSQHKDVPTQKPSTFKEEAPVRDKTKRSSLSDDPVLIYDLNTDELQKTGITHGAMDCVNIMRSTKHRNSECRSKRLSHPPRLESKTRNKTAIESVCDSPGIAPQTDLQHLGGHDNRGKHRKEPHRRSRSNSGGESQPPIQDHRVFEGHQEVKVIKEFKVKDSSKGHSSDSKIVVVMVKDDAKDEKKVKDKSSERAPMPERPERHRNKKTEVSRKESRAHLIQVEGDEPSPESPQSGEFKRDTSKSRASKRSKSKSKKGKDTSPSGSSGSRASTQTRDDKVIDGDRIRRSARSSRRRQSTHKVEQEDKVEIERESTSDLGADEEDENLMAELPSFPSNKLDNLQTENVMVMRSVSDISDKRAEEQRKKGLKERRQKVYKSDPFHAPGRRPVLPSAEQTGNFGHAEKRRQRHLAGRQGSCGGKAREEILTFLHGVQPPGESPHGILSNSCDDLSSEVMMSPLTPVSPATNLTDFPFTHPFLIGTQGSCDQDGPSGAEVERVDSGVGAELKDGTSSKEFKGGPICEDCESDLTEDNMSSESDFLCKKCESRRVERKETIQEIIDTEVSYGKDLNIIKEEFYMPMKSASLLSQEQLDTVFSNLEELITIADRFADDLLDALELSTEHGDEDYATVNIGQLFLSASNMLLAFETYCVNQASVPQLLEKLEVEKELLRIFLHVSQKENSLLRRMDLKAFLMVPVQRVMKYPLLLSRLHKVTAPHHEDRDAIRKAQVKVEDILEHINAQSSCGPTNASMRLKRKISGFPTRKTSSADDIEINKLAIEILGWNRKDVHFVLTGKLQYTQPTDHLWMKKGRTFKYMTVYALLITLGRGSTERWSPGLMFPRPTAVQEAALVLIKEKTGKFISLREPLQLDKCVVSVDTECDEVFEIMDASRESFLFKGEDAKETETWLQQLRLQTKDLGRWRRRRNALPNIMIQNMGIKS